MWKKSYLALCLISPFVLAEHSAVDTKALAIKTVQQHLALERQQEQQRLNERNHFLALESLLKTAEQQKRFSPAVFTLAEGLKKHLQDYPLLEEAEWVILKAKIKAELATNEEIVQFVQQYPKTAQRNRLAQIPFETLYQQQKWGTLLEYSKTVSANSMLNQCRLFSARFQLLAEQLNVNPEVGQTGIITSSSSPEMDTLLKEFDDFWQLKTNIEPNYWKTHGQLPSECLGIEAYWRDQGFRTVDKIKQKAVKFSQLDAKLGLADLLQQVQDTELRAWLELVHGLLNAPTLLQGFVENQPLTDENQAIVLAMFPKWVRTLDEQMANPDFGIIQRWAEKWQLSSEEIRTWKISFISRLFDNVDPAFQLWRDEQLKTLKVDNLTERRLRMAIFQQDNLPTWLALLSDDAKNKLEWRYWLAKTLPAIQQQTLLEEIAKERGFYPMLAAQQLGKMYQVNMPIAPQLTELQQQKWQKELARIKEFLTLERFSQAELVWVELLQAVDFNEKLALSQYALDQKWFDLAVEGTIQAKAWDYIPLRLPNAYADWFAINLQGKAVTQSFAMAIARQESAWNFQAKSQANAIGLMQMLPSTASTTAQNNQLVYAGERDLTDPFRSIMLGTTHLAELNEKYPQNRILIAAAYNAGASRVMRWLERANGRLTMDEFIASIPFLETRGYVQNVLTYDYYYQLLQKISQPIMFNIQEWDRKY